MRLLYVEDQPIHIEVMRAALALRPQLTLDVAMDGASARHAALSHAPDLLLLDLYLPDCHGTELLESLRALPELAHTPAIAVTADDLPDLKGSSFSEVWTKPIDIRQMLARLDALYTRHTLQKAARRTTAAA